MTSIKGDILKDIKKLGYMRGAYEVFFDLIDMIPHFLVDSGRRSFNLIELAEYEAAYYKAAARYSEDEMKIFYGMFEKIMKQMDEDPYDVLGPLYMAIIH